MKLFKAVLTVKENGKIYEQSVGDFCGSQTIAEEVLELAKTTFKNSQKEIINTEVIEYEWR